MIKKKTPRSEFNDEDDKYKIKEQNNNIDTKPSNVFNYLKSLSPEAKAFMDEIKDSNDDIDNGKFLFIGRVIKKNLISILLGSH